MDVRFSWSVGQLPCAAALRWGPQSPQLLTDRTLRRTQALGPRAIPTPAAVAAALRVLRVEEGGAGSESEEEDGGGRRQTALAKDPPEYFGFVG